MDRESISIPFKPFPLNLPILERASSCRNLLIARMGGGNLKFSADCPSTLN